MKRLVLPLVLPLVIGAFLISGPACAQSRETTTNFGARLSEAAIERTKHDVTYNRAYAQIDYPMGDVARHVGVCTDLVIRAYRALGHDLQMLVHEDMRGAFNRYPKIWGLSRPDTNIDHRRVPNLETFFRRHGEILPVTDDPADYAPGDLVTYRLPGGAPHIAIVTDQRTVDGVPLVAHNIGGGPELENFLFTVPINARFRFAPGSE